MHTNRTQIKIGSIGLRACTLGLAVFAAACSHRQPNGTEVTALAKTYEGFESDLRLLRKTSRINATNASSPEACHAAARVFKNVVFVGMTRKQVLKILGDPKTISDYGVTAGKNPDDPLVYRFDSGFGGVAYVVQFKDGKVTKVEANGSY